MLYTRRDVGKVALATLPMAKLFGAAKMINSKFGGVQIGTISYSFSRIYATDATVIIKDMVEIGLGEVELESGPCEQLAGAPAVPTFRGGGGAAARRGPGGAPGAGQPGGAPAAAGAAARGRGAGGGRAPLTPEQIAERDAAQKKLVDWRKATTPAMWAGVRKQFNDAGIAVAILCYNMQDAMTDDDIEYGFAMAKGLGVKAISTSTTLTMAKRIAPIADKHKLMVGYHGHDQTSDPNQTATLESYDTLMGYGGYNGINLDIGHFTAANYDAVAFIQKHHARITNLHLKDRKKNHGPGVLWGMGDTPIKQVLQEVKKGKYTFPCNIEWEIGVPEGSDLITEMKKCLKYCEDALA
ncbi:MAG: sugar phosphate isomerase/epimerase [Bryobacteraceae bacterium]|jgi:sugar phosphate isomerase/epimerase